MLAAPLLLGAVASPAESADTLPIPSVQARPADSLVDSFGVGVHMGYADTPYEDVPRVKEALTGLGVRHVRDNLNLSAPQALPAMRDVASTGVRFNLVMGRPGSWQTPDKLVQTVATELPGVVESLEGANEYNLVKTAVDWVGELRAHQQALYEAANANPATADLPVLAPALGQKTGFDLLGDLGAFADYGNAHLYPGGQQPSFLIDAMTDAERMVVPGKPVIYTEGGYHNAMNTTSGHIPTPESVVGSYAPRMLLEHYLRGTHRFYMYELFDQRADAELVDSEGSFGLLRNDFSPKPSYLALKNLLALTSDQGASFAPGQLAYRVDGGGSDLRQVLVQKRDGEFVLLLWRDVSIYDRANRLPLTVTPQSLTVQLGERSDVAVHQPTTGASPVATTTGTSVPVSLAGDVVALRIKAAPEPVVATPAPAPTPVVTAPTAPRNLTAPKISTTSVSLAWQAPLSDGGSAITKYVVSGSPKGSVSLSSTSRSYTLSGLRKNTSYTFKVQAVNKVGTSLAATLKVTTRR